VTPSGIECEAFRLVVQCLSQLHHRVPVLWIKSGRNNCDGCYFICNSWYCNLG